MKLATYKDGSRDGQLVVVSADLALAHYASGVATRLQQVLDDWNFLSPQLEELSSTLNHGKARHAFNFDPLRCMAPLPRAYQWVDGSAYIDPEEQLRKAGVTRLPEGSSTDPMMAQRGSDDFLGPTDPIRCTNDDDGVDFEAKVAVITADAALGCTPDAGIECVRLLMLAADVTLRALIPDELTKGLGLLQSKPASAFSPVAVTPDELGGAWRGGRVHLTLETWWNGQPFGRCEVGDGMMFHFGQLIAHLCKTRSVRAGCIVGSGAVGNTDRVHGCSCIAEKRAIEVIEGGKPRTDYLKFGDSVRIDMKGGDGLSVFGAIEQRLVSAHRP